MKIKKKEKRKEKRIKNKKVNNFFLNGINTVNQKYLMHFN